MFSKMFLYIFSGYLCLQEGIDMQIRFATVADTDALLMIYSQYIDTTITFEYVLPARRNLRSASAASAPSILTW